MAGEKILVVEDNPLNMELVVDILEVRGYEVCKAGSGQEALAVIKDCKPDLILMDVQLPGIDGLSLTRILKSDPSTRDILVVALTAHAMREDELKAYDAGCSAYVSKPFHLQEFSQMISRLLQEH